MRYLATLTLIIGTTIATLSVLARADDAPRHVTVYKDPQCSCCEGYADYLRHNGFDVTVVNTHDLALMNEEAGVPSELQGCHLAKVDGYVIGGHVPVDIVNRLLSEKPAIKGVTLPGMPMGSPGMTGTKTAPFKIYEITDGPPHVYATE